MFSPLSLCNLLSLSPTELRYSPLAFSSPLLHVIFCPSLFMKYRVLFTAISILVAKSTIICLYAFLALSPPYLPITSSSPMLHSPTAHLSLPDHHSLLLGYAVHHFNQISPELEFSPIMHPISGAQDTDHSTDRPLTSCMCIGVCEALFTYETILMYHSFSITPTPFLTPSSPW